MASGRLSENSEEVLRKSHSLFLSLAVMAFAVSVEAVTYIVPTDRDLVRRATAIVVATAVESHAELTASGGVVTRSELTIESVLKGALRADQSLQLVEPGGIMSERATLIPGSPRFENGQRYLLFLRRGADGEWSTWGLGLGRFSYTTDLQGRELVSRGTPGAIFGFDEGSWAPHVENLRAASEFAAFVRAVVKAPLAPASETYFVEPTDVTVEKLSIRSNVKKLVPGINSTRPDYLASGNFRWQGTSAPMGYCCSPTFQPGFDGPGAASAAVNNWNGVGTSFSYTGPTVNTGNKGLTGTDGMNTILFNDPNNELGAFPGAAGIGGITQAVGTYNNLGDGVTYFNTTEVDVVIAKNLGSIGQALFNAVVTHEVGHTLGFRHSNQSADNSSPCTAPLPCAGIGSAIMASTVSGVTTLQQWDRDAMNTVYGSGPVCTNPSIVAQPQSQTIAFGAQASLSVTAGGSTPLTYQWYVGTSGNTSTPVSGQTSSVFNPSPTSTTNYWVRVSNSCAPPAPADSQTATVTVQPCQGPAITAQPLDQSVTSGSSAFLSVSFVGSNPVTVTWFRGTAPDMSGGSIGTGPSISTPSLTSTSMFWARLQNSCGNVDTRTVTITVAPCQPPVINNDPPDQTVAPGSSANLFVGYSGTAGTVTWFRGTFPDSSSPAGSGQFFTTPTLSSTTSFWAQITNSCGSANSRTVVITVSFGCTSPTITTNPGNQTVVIGTSVTIAVVASGTGPLHYAWFQGTTGNESNPAGTDSSSFKSAALTTPTQFWVKVTNSCGSANSTAASVSLKPGRPRAVKHR